MTVLQHLTPPPAVPEGTGAVPDDLGFIVLLFVLFVVPKALQRYRIPAAITSLVLGALSANLGWVEPSVALNLLSTFGIVALFLFAGLEIDATEIRKGARTLVQHVLLWSLLMVLTVYLATRYFAMDVRPAALVALALLTPSTGFILSTLSSFGLSTSEQFAVKSKAVGAELIALAVLFFVLQTESVERFSFAVAALAGIVFVIPLAFRAFAANVAPYAPRSEFAFLLMVAVLCAWATRRLGVYYLVGAFIVGVAAQRFRERLPAMSSEKMIDALEAFGSVFIPFYFFVAGTHIEGEQLSWGALGLGVLLLVVFAPLRIGVTVLHRKLGLKETLSAARRVGVALVPTLVFTLVLVQILREEYATSETLLGGLVLYTVLNTMLPAMVLRTPPPSYEEPEAPEALQLSVLDSEPITR
ncbi:MAG TPA: cation:proton antiporter [Gemmatimonadaceae bacterium]|nr:cation:proton antiporter [Gemmatimonadaceae bacterium]